jgi:hypothetical protein
LVAKIVITAYHWSISILGGIYRYLFHNFHHSKLFFHRILTLTLSVLCRLCNYDVKLLWISYRMVQSRIKLFWITISIWCQYFYVFSLLHINTWITFLTLVHSLPLLSFSVISFILQV